MENNLIINKGLVALPLFFIYFYIIRADKQC